MEAHLLDGDTLRITQDPGEIRAALDQHKPIWVELQQKDHACDLLLSEQLQLHPLTVEDIWATRSQPKLEDYERYLYLIVHGVSGVKAGDVELMELDIVIGPSYVITHDPGHLVDQVRAGLARSPRLLQKGPAWLAHAILDTAVDNYLPVIDELDRKIEQLENEVLRKAGTRQGPAILRRILGYKRTLLGFRRTSIHQREILLRLARGEFDELPAEVMPFFRDVYDHFLRVSDLIESYRDLVNNALEAYLSVQSNRMNEVMKALTLMSTIMLPITFIAGLYGMNFEHMPELHTRWGYPAALLLMAATVGVVLSWFRRKGWIGPNQSMVVDEEEYDDVSSPS
ncbi:MAG TPA: magnesium/cobalt transporter CorA [Polyangiales bacterium]|nr:magnesium/cobalt transporter CorA [Polyangiales bacterium]